ncbi:hypothetical protein G3T36_00300 [Diaminobutyricibacter tongyongensis]|uniref:DUF3558 domain-containing protein n=1 Tax=Leifsonia tongyongensis TaxID=1268043 RepID=A0A6L9XSC3_9MICO|nr:hypothetical protein [Diaminobutyricibacter tongyongensis]NEN04303.1 hypothetical protein [Diaminobutyricibacter tongyongensis]
MSSQPTPTPTSAAIVAPTSRIPLGCATIVDQPAIAAVESTLTLTPTDPISPPYTRQVMREQAGNLNCYWDTPDQRTDSASLTVSADARAGLALTNRTDAPSLGVGDASWAYCGPKGGCAASVVAGDYWFDIQIGQISNSKLAPVDVVRAIAESVVSHLAAAGPALPAWQPPATMWSPVVSCKDLGAAVPMSDVMAPGPASSADQWNGPGDESPINNWTTRSEAFYNCAWDWTNAPVNQDMLIVQIVPGGEWVLPELESSPGVTSTPMTVPGATAAAYRCDGYPRCWADAIIDHSWVQLSGTSNNIPGIQEKMAKAFTALAAYAASK